MKIGSGWEVMGGGGGLIGWRKGVVVRPIVPDTLDVLARSHEISLL